jgi:hypothetical protein
MLISPDSHAVTDLSGELIRASLSPNTVGSREAACACPCAGPREVTACPNGVGNGVTACAAACAATIKSRSESAIIIECLSPS